MSLLISDPSAAVAPLMMARSSSSSSSSKSSGNNPTASTTHRSLAAAPASVSLHSNGNHSNTNDSTMYIDANTNNNTATTTETASHRRIDHASPQATSSSKTSPSDRETMRPHQDHMSTVVGVRGDVATDEDDEDVPLPSMTGEDSNTNQKSFVAELLTVTLHLSSTAMASTTVTDFDHGNHHRSNSSTDDFVRVILIPISGLEQREAEMTQTARALQIPITRWNGSLLYNIYQQQQQRTLENGCTDTTGESRRITLHLYQDSDLKWSTTASNGSINEGDSGSVRPEKTTTTIAGLSSSVSSPSIWFGACLHKNIDLDWIQSYYVTGRISIPSNARGYDVLWLLEYFQLMYQPDQFHFANYATYTRVQLWSKYYCYLRPQLIDWIIHEINQQQKQYQLRQPSQGSEHQGTMFPLLFGTMGSNETSVELGTDRLLPLGDVTVPLSVSSKVRSGSSSKRTLADRALKLFNTCYVETSTSHTTNHHHHHHHHHPSHKPHSETRNCTDEAQSQTTVPCPEELTATEIRNDFCRFLKFRLCEHDAPDNQKLNWNVQFTVRPVTVNCNYEDRVTSDDMMNSNSSNSSTPVTNGSAVFSESAGTNKSFKNNNKTVHQRYLVAHRAVLVVDAQPQQVSDSEFSTLSQHQHRVTPIKECRTKSDLSAPVDELVEEEIAKGRLEELLQQVKARGEIVNDKRDRRVTINETLSFEKEKNLRTNDERKMIDAPIQPAVVTSQKSIDILDLNVPDDELNASLDNGNNSFNASIGIFPMTAMKKKKKPKPVFVLPDKLLDVDNAESPQLARMKVPIVKTLPIVGSKPNDILALPGPITIVRKGTFDNTVTSALTGPFYVDENGVLRDVFENCDPDSDEDFEGDEDTRAQARRHEWIQTALLNRGIGERMETLLKEDREPNTNSTTTSFDPWDWITGLNVCELSREVIRSVEQYANCVLCESSSATDQKSSTNVVAAVPMDPLYPSLSGEKTTVVSTILNHTTIDNQRAKDNIHPVYAGTQDEQSREDEHYDHIVENIVFTSELDSREGSFGSQRSKESPRGVQRFDSASSADKVSAEPIDSEQAGTSVSQSGREDTAAAKLQEKKNRGIKGLFRRKRVDSTSTGI